MSDERKPRPSFADELGSMRHGLTCPTCRSTRPDEHPAIGVMGIPDACDDPFHQPQDTEARERWTIQRPAGSVATLLLHAKSSPMELDEWIEVVPASALAEREAELEQVVAAADHRAESLLGELAERDRQLEEAREREKRAYDELASIPERDLATISFWMRGKIELACAALNPTEDS